MNVATTAVVGLSFSAADVIALGAALVALVGAGVAFRQAQVVIRGERWRLQPVVVVYESRAPALDRLPAGADPIACEVFLVNEGPGPAFDVRFGIEVGEYRCYYKPAESHELGKGELPRVMGGGGRAPAGGASYRIGVPRSVLERFEERAYWCTFENAYGERHATRNWWRYESGLQLPKAEAVPDEGLDACAEC